MDRARQREEFIRGCGYQDVAIEPLPVDASARSYFRLKRNEGTVILMDAPPASEDIGAFIRIGEHLSAMGLSTPELYARDLESGFMLLEDFGKDSYSRLLGQGHSAEDLYNLAVDVLVHLHEQAGSAEISVPPYDRAFMMMEVELLPQWYWPVEKGADCPQEVSDAYQQAWQDVFAAAPDLGPELVIRDFHVDNLMILDGRKGIRRCGVLDFQGALMGKAPYDLMSLLEDARRDVPDELASVMRERYLSARQGLDRDIFLHWYDLLGAQRHAKILGGFMRTWKRDGKDGYLRFMPRVRRQLAVKLESPLMAPVKDWFKAHFPLIWD